MERQESYLQTAEKLIAGYYGKMPFSNYIKLYFASNKKFGSRDRRQISTLCFCFFRTFNFPAKSLRESIIISAFLCTDEKWSFYSDVFLNYANKTTDEKFSLLNYSKDDLFKFKNFLSPEIDKIKYSSSYLNQPNLYLRIRPGFNRKVISVFEKNNIGFEIENDCISLPPSIKVQELFSVNKEVVVQDKNSQKVLDYFSKIQLPLNFKVWDCCAASGGKSILLSDKVKYKFQLFVSDVRQSILIKLKQRFKEAVIQPQKIFAADLSKPYRSNEKYDLIICDAPCSGSGTWQRTPEQQYFFKEKMLNDYSQLQKHIISNSLPALKKGGFFFYITCSVFEKENEENVKYIESNFDLKLLHKEYLKGYMQKADTLFVAIFS